MFFMRGKPLSVQRKKIVAMSEDNKFVLIKHIGKHKCLAKTVIESQILEEIEIFFEKNQTRTRSSSH